MTPQIVIGLISGLIPIVNNILGWIDKARTTLKQSKELTPEQEKTLDDYIDAIDKPAWWKVEE